MKTEIKKIGECEYEIIGEIPAEIFESKRARAVANVGKNAKVDGFREGHIPEAVLAKHCGEPAILEEMAEMALSSSYAEIIAEHKLDIIGRPEVSITKLAKGNPLGFKMKVSVMPEVKLSDYKTIAKEVMLDRKEAPATEEKEIDDVIEHLRKMREEKDKPIPEANDEFAKTLGNFESIADLRNKISENIRLEKEVKERDKRRIDIVEKVADKSDIPLPQILIEGELNNMIAEIKSDLARASVEFKDYLEKAKKTEEEIRKEMREKAEKRAKFGLVLSNIAKEEKLLASPEEIERETARVLEAYKGADPERARWYVEGQLVNEKVFQFLENQK